MTRTLGEWALEYASEGICVFPTHSIVRDADGVAACSCGKPCKSPGKHPRVMRGLLEATDDASTVERWWRRWPDANVALATGARSGLVCIDVDCGPGKVGMQSFEALLADQDATPFERTARVETGGGGMHLFFKHPGGGVRVPSRVNALGTNIDIRADGGYVVAPPSKHASGRDYAWAIQGELEELPAWLLARIEEKAVRAATERQAPVERGEATDPVTPGDLLKLAKAWAHPKRPDNVRRWGRLLERAVSEGLPISTEGDRNTKTSKLAWRLAKAFPYGRASDIAEAFGPSLALQGEPTVEAFAASIAKSQIKVHVSKDAIEYHATDRGNAERLVALHGSKFRYCPELRSFLIWTGKRWEIDAANRVALLAKETIRALFDAARLIADDERRAEALAFANASESSNRFRGMLELVQTEPGVCVRADELDADTWLFNCANGTLNLRTGVLAPHDPTDLITKLSPVEYVPDARSEVWERFLVETTGGDASLSSFLQRAAGYAIQGTAREKVYLFSFGPPDTGKGTFNDSLVHAFGDYHTNSDARTWLVSRGDAGGNRGDLVRLRGARLISASEFPPYSRFDQGLLKKFSGGGDQITAAAKYQSDVSFVPQALLWFQGNDVPILPDEDEASWKRVRRIPFAVTVAEADKDESLKDRLREPEHAAAVLAWAVRGCLEWQSAGLGTCDAVRTSTLEYRAEMDILGDFTEDRLVWSADAWSSTVDLYQAYSGWCVGAGISKPLDVRAFGRLLAKRRGVEPERRGHVRGWSGVAVRKVGASGGVRASLAN